MNELGQFVSQNEFQRLARLHWVAKFFYRCVRDMADRSVHFGYVGLRQPVTWPWLIAVCFNTDNKRGPKGYEMHVDYLRKIVCPKLRRAGLLELTSTKDRLIFYVPSMGKGKYARKKLSDILSDYSTPLQPTENASVSLGKLGNWALPTDANSPKLSGKLSDSPSLFLSIQPTVVAKKERQDSGLVEKSELFTTPTTQAMRSKLKKNSRGRAESDRASPSEESIALGDRLGTKRLHIRAAAWDDPAA